MARFIKMTYKDYDIIMHLKFNSFNLFIFKRSIIKIIIYLP